MVSNAAFAQDEEPETPKPEDVVLNVLPMSFDYGLYQALMAARVGATLVLEKSFAYPFDILRRVSEEGVTGFPGVPTMFATLRCSRAAASRTASLMPGSMRRFSVEILVLAMRYNIT